MNEKNCSNSIQYEHYRGHKNNNQCDWSKITKYAIHIEMIDLVITYYKFVTP